jgi:hypothetical protein
VCKGVDFATSDKLILFLAPFHGKVTIEEASPAYTGLFLDELVVPARELGQINPSAFEPTIETGNEDVKEVMIRGIGIVSLS